MTNKYQRPSNTYEGNITLNNRDKYQQDASQQPRVAISSAKIDGDFNYILDALNDIDQASGTRTSINDRLSVALNDDGSLKASASMVLDDWVRVERELSFVQENQISIMGNHEGALKETRKVKLIANASPLYGYVKQALYDGEKTLVTVENLVNENNVLTQLQTLPTSFSYSSVYGGVQGNSPSLFDGLLLKNKFTLQDVNNNQFAILVEDDMLKIQKNMGDSLTPNWQTVSTFTNVGMQLINESIEFTKLSTQAIATQAEAEAGTANDKLMTAQRTKQAIEALSPAPTFRAFKVSLSSFFQTDSHVETKVPFDVVLFEEGTTFDTTNNYYVVPETGVYQFTLRTAYPTHTSETHRLEIFKNGSIIDNMVGGDDRGNILTTMNKFNAGDIIEAYVYQGSGTDKSLLHIANGAYATTFEGLKLG